MKEVTYIGNNQIQWFDSPQPVDLDNSRGLKIGDALKVYFEWTDNGVLAIRVDK